MAEQQSKEQGKPEGKGRRKVKIGDAVKLAAGRTMVMLPDGTVVTARGAYRVEHEGDHKVIGGPAFVGVKG